jgi:cyanophycinase-like exopeptidase
MKTNFLYFLLACLTLFASCSKDLVKNVSSVNTDVLSIEHHHSASIGIMGDTGDIITKTTAGFVLMGGSTDVNAAIKWMLQRSGGGDVVVIRSTGTDAYDNYMARLYPVNSVETLLIDSKKLANDPQVADRIKQAECLFIAGGDQSQYVNFWKGTLVNDAINYLINTKKVPVGGTSAGCMVLSHICFDAQNGTVTSSQVLKNPYNKYATFSTHFINVPFLQNIITDTHYNNPDRRGRQVGFMARLFQDSGFAIKGIGVQEQTAVAIDENGAGKVFGSGNAFFLSAKIAKGNPEVCVKNMPLTWNKNMHAVSVYKIKGSNTGNGNVNIPTWSNFSGGTSMYFSVNNGMFTVE